MKSTIELFINRFCNYNTKYINDSRCFIVLLLLKVSKLLYFCFWWTQRLNKNGSHSLKVARWNRQSHRRSRRQILVGSVVGPRLSLLRQMAAPLQRLPGNLQARKHITLWFSSLLFSSLSISPRIVNHRSDICIYLIIVSKWMFEVGDRFLGLVVRSLQIHGAGLQRHGRQAHRRWLCQDRCRRVVRTFRSLRFSLFFFFPIFGLIFFPPSSKDVAQEFRVQAMPTFVLLKQGKEVDRVVGAKKEELETKIKKHRQNWIDAS